MKYLLISLLLLTGCNLRLEKNVEVDTTPRTRKVELLYSDEHCKYYKIIYVVGAIDYPLFSCECDANHHCSIAK